ncbi:MAG: hypothetical protein Q4D97_02200 [Eubacteriales bacterium]|nr:hypothetical protein [Eubacteriales bacterium]
MNKSRRIFFYLLLVLGLSFTLTACKPQVVVETVPAENQAANTSTSPDPLMAKAPQEEESVSDQATQSSSATTQATEPQRTFAPQETGAEPNPDSPFGQLSAEEQNQLVDWLSQLAASYQNISQYFGDFARDLATFSAEAGATLADQEFFQDLSSKCREELAKIEAKAAEGLPQAAEGLKQKAADIAAWYDSFLADLAQLNPQDGSFVEQISQQLDQAMQKMQEFLDSLVAFSS